MNFSTIISFVFKILNRILPIRNIIVFESLPDMADNTKEVFDELVRRGFNKKYKMVWLVNKKDSSLPKIHNVHYVLNSSKIRHLYRITGKCFICCNQWLDKSRDKQTSFYLSHGTPIKSVSSYYPMPDGIDYCISAGEDVIPLYVSEFHAKADKTYPLGFPRNDALTNADIDIKSLFPELTFEKAVVWYPTYRQHKNGFSVSADMLPIISDEETAIQLNKTAAENKILIVLKPHFQQDVQYVKKLNLSNLIFIDDEFFTKNNISSYEFVGSCDSLITDYSSIYYDYTLCDKPIALIWQDYEEYKKNPGFAPGAEKYLAGGEKIYTLDQLQSFLVNIANHVDILKNERNAICKMVNASTDGQNTQRVVDFIIDKANL